MWFAGIFLRAGTLQGCRKVIDLLAFIYVNFSKVLFLPSENIAGLIIAQTIAFFTGIIFYKKVLKFAKQLYNCFYTFKVICFYSLQGL